MNEHSPPKENWASLLERHAPLQLPAAHDALTAKLIERAGFHAYQIGGVLLVGAGPGFARGALTRVFGHTGPGPAIPSAPHLPPLVAPADWDGGAPHEQPALATTSA